MKHNVLKTLFLVNKSRLSDFKISPLSDKCPFFNKVLDMNKFSL